MSLERSRLFSKKHENLDGMKRGGVTGFPDVVALATHGRYNDENQPKTNVTERSQRDIVS